MGKFGILSPFYSSTHATQYAITPMKRITVRIVRVAIMTILRANSPAARPAARWTATPSRRRQRGASDRGRAKESFHARIRDQRAVDVSGTAGGQPTPFNERVDAGGADAQQSTRFSDCHRERLGLFLRRHVWFRFRHRSRHFTNVHAGRCLPRPFDMRHIPAQFCPPVRFHSLLLRLRSGVTLFSLELVADGWAQYALHASISRRLFSNKSVRR
jgi:hypothetical protein